MGRSKADFYHGTSHGFAVGDVVRPGADGLAWASTNRAVASNYGKNIYRVSPIDDVTRHSGAAKEFGIHYSKSGYRVEEKVSE